MRKLPNVLNREQVRKLLDAIDAPWLMVAVMIALFCGLRRNEVRSLQVQDVDLTTRRLRVLNGKSPSKTTEGYGKDRVVPIPTCIMQVLQQWLTLLPPNATFIFPSIKNPSESISGEHLWKEYKRALSRAGIDRITHTDASGMPRHLYNFHTLRHTYATFLWEKTGDILTVKNALGHSKLDTTLVYTHVTNTVVENKINEAFSNRKESLTLASGKQTSLDPLSILMRRLALGEIDMKTFLQVREKLRGERQENAYIG